MDLVHLHIFTKMKKNLLFAVMAAGVVAFSATVYFQGNSASSDLLLANVEALSGDEGVDDCDIFTYVRDAVENYSEPTRVTTSLSTGGTIVVTIGGIDFPISGGGEVGVTKTVRYGICPSKDNNCCAKSHLSVIQEL